MSKPHNARVSIAEYVKAIEEANGLIAVAARRLGVTRQSIYAARDRSAKVREALANARETTTDLAEGKLFSKINEGDMTAIIFYLKTQAKDRGYVERQERHHTGTLDVRKLQALSDEELDGLADDLGLTD